MAALSLNGVRKTYDGKHAVLHGIDVEIADGEFVVLVGPSGCGKSTLLRMIAGLESISEGEIAIGGQVVNTLEPKDRDIAMVFQNYALYPHMTVAQNMGYGLKIRGIERAVIEQRVASAARILELEPLLARRPRELSGGQRQRVAMGRAIVREPAVFLFDEPLSNLDAKLRVQMRLEIQRLHGRLRTTSVYVTHDQIEAMTLAQRVIVMNLGRAEQIGAPVDVYEKPATVFVAGFIGSPAMNLLRGRLSADGALFEVNDGGPRLPVAGAAGIGREVAPGREWVLGVRPEHMTPQPGMPVAPLVVDSCELLGADNLVHGRWGPYDLAVRLPYAERPARGTALAVSLPAHRLHFFDPVTGRRAN
ncbi:sn-glycerol-3-phosphate import ATP-binding protein UgpC [Burkholderia glumae]|uniref:Sn-glycerol-3-phosphate import ATP-binding protein UgpC n=2 Tax=Burkholderia glumae TaxID=337 RepID=A0ABY5BIB7_BURGL|nr:sn-glycerol-3-phosphate import ATP-binding protein UgpC [Burkholderia glumae]ACR27510.1 glycerol-3-phosphate transporter ATP-binding subunit [Burkholderia glumae BGR1]KHJ60792.1 glycerol-3-phosphate ABC transporter ATP-binding protein [Burkholderia glumae]MCM2481529.1 sn-glycerol-3-phosphate import ATP-binding protein UgpC [Burkholderia glumae]MCM2491836.1 sn-glycerol-3-phosphate import ATP-binding protein UgpC [Burkholderia glumae]MCM2508331.1 sn-glycerol-3-phosphate import ATP-binding pro